MQANNSTKTELGRDLGFTTALAIGVGTMIAAGIFTLSGLAIRNVGSGAIVSFLLAAVVSLFTALTYCEFVSIYPRSGEGYLYARKTFSAPLAYMVGWALFLGYVSSCSFYISSLSSYFMEFIWHTPIESISGIVFLIGLTFLNIKGSKESGKFQVIVTIVKVVLLVWFIIGGMRFVSSEEMIDKFNNDIFSLLETSALVFITFFGFSAIAASAGEVKDPVKNIPKAIFWSVGIVSVLYIFVVAVIIAADLTEYNEAAMGVAAVKFLGPVGGMVIVAGGIFSMVSASNASIMAGSRVALAMSDLGHLPKELGIVNSKTKTPIMALLFVSGLILVFSMTLELEDLAHFADTVLLIALILVNIALIIHRRKFPDIERPFKVPLVPLVPILGILANAYLITQLFAHLMPLLLALSSLLLGFLGFLAWKGSIPEAEAIPGEPSKLAMAKGLPKAAEHKKRILVPVANPSSIPTLIKLASNIAISNDAALVIVRVLTVPNLMPLDHNFAEIESEKKILDQAHKEAAKYNVPVASILRIGHNTAKAILETAREQNCSLLLLGWKGYSSSADKILGQITDAVVTHAKHDIMLVKLSSQTEIKKILLPTAGGDHARAAEKYAAAMGNMFDGTLTLCRVVAAKNSNPETLKQVQEELNEAKKRVQNTGFDRVNTQIIDHDSVVDGIIEASADYDTVVTGATRDSIYQQIMFGSIPEDLAKKLQTNMIVIKHHSHIRALWGKVLSE